MLSGCLQMMITQTAQSTAKIMHGTTTPKYPASSSGKQLARMTHRTVIKIAAGRAGDEVTYTGYFT